MNTRATALYPFVPSGPDFRRSIAFFALLGFEKIWENAGLAGLRFGDAYFLLQEIDVPEWQRNQMITFEVDDLNSYWSELESQSLSATYPDAKLAPPRMFPWGRELHIVDPAGVCWHVRQAGG